MKALDALYPVFWSVTALATLYLVLHRPAPGVTAELGGSGWAECELTLVMKRPQTGVVMRGVVDHAAQCGLPVGTVLVVELAEPRR